MVLEYDPDFEKDIIIEKLKSEGRDAYKFITYVEFLFSPAVQFLFGILNFNFLFGPGHPAYNRTKLYGIFMYAYLHKTFTITGVAYLCRKDKVLRCFTNGSTPSPNCLDDFLRNSNRVVMKAIFICTLVELNDLGKVEFKRIYIDSTDGKINGSVNYKLNSLDLKCLKLMHDWGYLHNGTAHKMNKYRKKLKKLLIEYENDKEMKEYIENILKNMRIYDKKVYRKYNVIEKHLDDDPDGYVCVMFPEARFMKTKKGRFEFALLIQQAMLNNGIVFSGLVQSKPNDSTALREILDDLKETLTLMETLQLFFGERRNYKEIHNALETTIMILDSGYFSDENLEAAYENDIHVLIMPRVIARRINDKLRGKKFQDIDYILNEEIEKVTKRHADITSKGYVCPYGVHCDKCVEKKINSDFNNKREGKDENLKEVSYNYSFQCPPDCPVIDKCTINPIEDRISVLKHDMIQKLTNKRYLKIYAERFGANEQIFGTFKGIIEIIKLLGSNKAATQNHLYIMNTSYNLNRKVSIKCTYW